MSMLHRPAPSPLPRPSRRHQKRLSYAQLRASHTQGRARRSANQVDRGSRQVAQQHGRVTHRRAAAQPLGTERGSLLRRELHRVEGSEKGRR